MNQILRTTIATSRLLKSSSFLKAPLAPASTYQRWYRGDSGDSKHRSEVTSDQDAIVAREEKLLSVAAPKYEQIQERHVRMPRLDEIPKASLPFDMKDSDYTTEELELEVRKKRLVYRAKQRGW
jgi:hypothetical protein